MKLRIVENKDIFSDCQPGTYILSFDQFGNKAYHPYLATQKWDEAIIEVNDKTPRGIIRQLVHSVKVIPVYDKEKITPRIMTVLCEICVDDAVRLRQLYVTDKEAFAQFLNELKERYGW